MTTSSVSIEDHLPGEDNDSILVLDDTHAVETCKPDKSWLVLIVDDERDVHEVTELSLRGMVVEGRELQFLHAYSCAQAREIVATHADIAVILLDVVMESHDAGLQLVQVIRQECGRSSVRIVLRTGQPGFAPEIETIQKYDINDYRTKTELTQVRLFTSLAGAIRSYRHLVAMEETRRGLEVVVHASTELSQVRGVTLFAKGMVIQLCALMNIRPDGLVCARAGNSPDEAATVIVATGIYAPLMAISVDNMPRTPIREAIEKCLHSRTSLFDQATVLYFPGTRWKRHCCVCGRGSAFSHRPASHTSFLLKHDRGPGKRPVAREDFQSGLSGPPARHSKPQPVCRYCPAASANAPGQVRCPD
jgi:CheY-like chemotaxis protein